MIPPGVFNGLVGANLVFARLLPRKGREGTVKQGEHKVRPYDRFALPQGHNHLVRLSVTVRGDEGSAQFLPVDGD